MNCNGGMNMSEFGIYLLKSACWLTGFALVYFLFLRNERFFALKRIFLVSGILVSLIFPFISFHYQVELPPPDFSTLNQEQSILSYSPGVQQVITGNKFDFKDLILCVYLAGLFLIPACKAGHLFHLVKAIYRNRLDRKDPVKVIRASEFRSSFSFFNYVFIDPSVGENESREILIHELVHVRQKHWLDLLLAEFLRILQWANPIAWIYTGFIRLNHEHLADKEALEHSSNPAIYKVALLNQIYRTPLFGLSNPFNYSLNKNRFEMMKKIITSPYRKLKVLLVIPVIAFLFYAFAEPEINYSGQINNSIKEASLSMAGDIRGIVLKEDGQPFPGVQIAVTGTEIRGTTDASGNFTISGVPEDSHIVFSYRGCITQVLKPQFSGSMSVRLLKDPDYPGIRISSSYQNAIVIIDGVISEKPQAEVLRDFDEDQIARMSVLPEKDALSKYGEKGKNGVVEITTRKKAAELGIKVPFRRQNPEDYPTFQNESFLKFGNWLSGRINYPADATAGKKEGRVTLNFVIQPDGSLTNPTIMSAPDPVLGEAVIIAVKESPQWEPAKNTEVQDPFSTSVTVRFELPDKVMPDDTYIIVEQMPEYPGGSSALLEFIKNNLRYPQAAVTDKIEGRVILRFVVNTKGMVEDVVVLKGVHPLLDAEAIRVVNQLSGWLPGAQGGKPVNVWYMVPVNFSLTPETRGVKAPEPFGKAPFVNPEQMPQFPGGPQAMFLAIADRSQYPEEAKKQKQQGRVLVRFIVTSEGKVKDPIVTESVYPLLDAEAIRVVGTLPDFKPGMQGGKPVDAYFTVPITFTLK